MLNQKQSINFDKSTKIVKQRLFSNQHLKISHRGAAFKDLLALRCSLRKESMDLCLLANVMFFRDQMRILRKHQGEFKEYPKVQPLLFEILKKYLKIIQLDLPARSDIRFVPLQHQLQIPFARQLWPHVATSQGRAPRHFRSCVNKNVNLICPHHKFWL